MRSDGKFARRPLTAPKPTSLFPMAVQALNGCLNVSNRFYEAGRTQDFAKYDQLLSEILRSEVKRAKSKASSAALVDFISVRHQRLRKLYQEKRWQVCAMYIHEGRFLLESDVEAGIQDSLAKALVSLIQSTSSPADLAPSQSTAIKSLENESVLRMTSELGIETADSNERKCELALRLSEPALATNSTAGL